MAPALNSRKRSNRRIFQNFRRVWNALLLRNKLCSKNYMAFDADRTLRPRAKVQLLPRGCSVLMELLRVVLQGRMDPLKAEISMETSAEPDLDEMGQQI